MLQIWISLLQVTKSTACTSTVQTVAPSISMFSASVIEPLLKAACMHVCGRAHVCILPDQLAMHGWTRRGLWPLRRHWAAPTRQGRGGAGWAGRPSAAKFVWYVASPTTQVMFGLAEKEKKKRLFLPEAGRNCSREEWGWVRHRKSEWCWRGETQPARKEQRGNRGWFTLKTLSWQFSFSECWASSYKSVNNLPILQGTQTWW